MKSAGGRNVKQADAGDALDLGVSGTSASITPSGSRGSLRERRARTPMDDEIADTPRGQAQAEEDEPKSFSLNTLARGTMMKNAIKKTRANRARARA